MSKYSFTVSIQKIISLLLRVGLSFEAGKELNSLIVHIDPAILSSAILVIFEWARNFIKFKYANRYPLLKVL
jgi:hypothetical protein